VLVAAQVELNQRHRSPGGFATLLPLHQVGEVIGLFNGPRQIDVLAAARHRGLPLVFHANGDIVSDEWQLLRKVRGIIQADRRQSGGD
jgi:hypothetical protein